MARSFTFTLDFQFNNKHAFGRFRLSVAGDPPAPDRQRQRFVAGNFTDPWARLAAAYVLNGRDGRAAEYFGRALARADGYEARQPILQFAAQFGDVLSELIKRRPDDPQFQLALARQLAAHGKLRLAELQPAQAQAALDQSHALFAHLRAKSAEQRWTVLTPTKMTSEGGATLTVQADGSILAGGTNPDRDVYTLVARPGLDRITAIRLEALPDPFLPNNGPGRADNGNFHLNELRVASAGVPASPTDITVAFDEIQDFRKVIDGKIDASKGWSNYPRSGKANTAVVSMDLKRGRDDDLRIELYFSAQSIRSTIWAASACPSRATTAPWTRNGCERFQGRRIRGPGRRLAKVHAQQGRTDQAVLSLIEVLGLAEDRAAKGKVVDEAAPGRRAGKAGRAGGGRRAIPGGAGRHYAERGNLPLAEAAGAKAPRGSRKSW